MERVRARREEHGGGRVGHVEVLGDGGRVSKCAFGGGIVDYGERVVGAPISLLACRRDIEFKAESLDIRILNPLSLEWNALVVESEAV